MDSATTEPENEIMRYFDNEMNSTERAAFEAELAASPALQEELKDLETARKAILLHGIHEQVTAIRKERTAAGQTPVRKMNNYSRIIKYSIAAAACVMLAYFGINRFTGTGTSADKLYAAEYVRFEPSGSRGTGDVPGPIEKAYLEKNYTEVTQLYSSSSTPMPRDMILAGVAYLETSNSAAAETTFRLLLSKNQSTNSSAYNDDASYYLALAELKNKEYSSAADLMDKIAADDGNVYHTKFDKEYIKKVRQLK
ncbi:MAG: hypothetical protein ABJA78_15910 [Ferruginibacter sp.]